MAIHRCRRTLVVAAAVLCAVVPAGTQEDARTLFEAGKYQDVVDRTPAESPSDAQYVKGLALLKLNRQDEAKQAFRRLESAGGAWQSVGRSAVALIDGNSDAALEAANAAVAGGPAEAQHQLGLVLEARGDSAGAAGAFAKAAEAAPRMAYAHYHAGMNFYKAKRIDQMAVYFENFLKLAPNAPERPAVESIMRTVRGR